MGAVVSSRIDNYQSREDYNNLFIAAMNRHGLCLANVYIYVTAEHARCCVVAVKIRNVMMWCDWLVWKNAKTLSLYIVIRTARQNKNSQPWACSIRDVGMAQFGIGNFYTLHV